MAANAYSNSLNMGAKAVGAGQKTEGDISFSDFLMNNIQKSIDTVKGGEQTSAKAITGEADVTDVVQAVTAAELTLQTVVSIRDRLISAYQDIMRMPI